MTLQDQANELLKKQLSDWPMLRENHEKLAAAMLRTFSYGGFSILAQWNPKRILSTSARIDEETVLARPCFLCRESWPPEEKHVAYGKAYEILCNPYPIFDDHLTISTKDHTPQVIDPEFPVLLDLSRQLPSLVVLYNAPSCGASAPDHMHFQAGNREFMPVYRDSGSLAKRYGTEITGGPHRKLVAVDDGLRRFILAESGDKTFIGNAFRIISEFMRNQADGEEPMLNILCYFDEAWKVFFFLRRAHRPWQYYEKGEGNIMLSPGSVDMGGTLVVPLEKDFRKLSHDLIRDIFNQVVVTESVFHRLHRILEKGLHA